MPSGDNLNKQAPSGPLPSESVPSHPPDEYRLAKHKPNSILPPDPPANPKGRPQQLPANGPSSLLPDVSDAMPRDYAGFPLAAKKSSFTRWRRLGTVVIAICILVVIGPAMAPRLDPKSTPAILLKVEKEMVAVSEAIRSGLSCAATLPAFTDCSGPGLPDPPTAMARAKAAISRQDTNAATGALHAVLKQEPNNGEARYLLGSVLHRSWRSELAAVELQKALDLGFESHGAVTVVLARAILRQQRWQQVVEKAAPSQSFDAAANAAILSLRGRALLMLNELPKAQLASVQASASQPDNAEALLLEALISAHRGDLGAALKHTEALIARTPEHFEGLLLHADLLRASDKFDEALTVYERLIKIEPYYIPARMARASLYLLLDKPGEAQADVNAASAMTGNNPALYFMQSMLLLKFGRYEDAQNPLIWVRRHTPDFPIPPLALAYVYYSTGEIEQARQFARQQLSTYPQDPHAQKLLETIEQRRAHGGHDTEKLDPNSELGKVFSNESSSALARGAFFQTSEFASAVSNARRGPPRNASRETLRPTP